MALSICRIDGANVSLPPSIPYLSEAVLYKNSTLSIKIIKISLFKKKIDKSLVRIIFCKLILIHILHLQTRYV